MIVHDLFSMYHRPPDPYHRLSPDLPRHAALEQDPPAWDRGAEDDDARRARQLGMLRRIADMAMDLSERAYRRAVARDEALGDVAGPGASAGGAEVEVEVEVEADARSLDRIEGEIDGLERSLARGVSGGEARADVSDGDPSLVFGRLSRVMFRAFALENQIAAEAKAAAAEAEAEANPYYDPEITPERKAKIKERWNLLLSRKNLVVKVVQTEIVRQRPNEDAEACGRALNDYLLEFERSQVLNQTTRECAGRHCDRFGLTLDWSRWENEPWALAEADGQLAWNRNPYPGGGP
jgi:hypothetical protein